MWEGQEKIEIDICSWVLLLYCTIYHDITCSTATSAIEHRSDFELTKDTPYLTLLCIVEFKKKRPHYDCIVMNIVGHKMKGNALIRYKDEEY